MTTEFDYKVYEALDRLEKARLIEPICIKWWKKVSHKDLLEFEEFVKRMKKTGE